MKDGNKRSDGIYYTTGNPFNLEVFSIWLKISDSKNNTILEPFAGSNNIPKFVDDIYPNLNTKWISYDINPNHPAVIQQDTIKDFPRGYEVCITNPPWLAKNSAKRRGLPFPDETEYDDLYKYALERCLMHCRFVAAIVPESFIRSGLFIERLWSFISLTKVDGIFQDTDHPVGLALFNNIRFNYWKTSIWRDRQLIGYLNNLKKHLPSTSNNLNIKFNDPAGNLGLIAIDNTEQASIRFCHPDELEGYDVSNKSRSITKINVPWDCCIESLNLSLNTMRELTQDVFMTSFKGMRKDGLYRRRLDFALARSIIDELNPENQQLSMF